MSGKLNTENADLSYEVYGLSSEHFEHLITLMEAFDLYQEKDSVRGDLWRQFPPSDKIRELDERVRRLSWAYEQIKFMPPPEGPEDPYRQHREAVLSDSIDIINFCVFLIRQIKEGARG